MRAGGAPAQPAPSLPGLCVALDDADRGRLRELAVAVAPHAAVLKLGLTALFGAGPDLVGELAALRPVFADAKLADIPAQVEGAAAALAGRGASYLTVHALAGREAVAAAVRGAGEATVLAVTVLTSLDDRALDSLGIAGPASRAVARLAGLALGAGAGGLVCSAAEAGDLRTRFGPTTSGGPLLVVPGVRPAGASAGDQRRVATPQGATAAGADLVVVGRPVTAAPDPGEAAAALAAALRGASP